VQNESHGAVLSKTIFKAPFSVQTEMTLLTEKKPTAGF